MPSLEIPANVQALLDAHAPVAIGVSGGKDSVACALAVAEDLAARGHRGPKLLVHADLGMVEWADSGPSCERLESHLQGSYPVPRGPDPHPRNWALHVTRRAAGGMMERWEGRWQSSVRRYLALECVKVILPWSTPSMRFCTSELKSDPIAACLKKLFGDVPVISVTGIRAEESTKRAKMPASKRNAKLAAGSLDWNPILRWSLAEVFGRILRSGLALHEAYRVFGSSRVSCAYCIMSAAPDLLAALRDPRNFLVFERMCALEISSGFAFQDGKWLANLHPAPSKVPGLGAAKALMAERERIEARIPKHLLFTKGWPKVMPTAEEALLMAEIRTAVCRLYGWEPTFDTADAILARYAELMATNAAKLAAKAEKAARKLARAAKRKSQPATPGKQTHRGSVAA